MKLRELASEWRLAKGTRGDPARPPPPAKAVSGHRTPNFRARAWRGGRVEEGGMARGEGPRPRTRPLRPRRAVRGSRAVSRSTVQQLEKSQLVQKDKDGGRIVTAKGRKLIDNLSTALLKEMAAQNPELSKYL